jgi:GDPmannose 4,6-dehydratase
MKKVALAKGINCQDDSFRAKLLLKNGYATHVIKRRVSTVSAITCKDSKCNVGDLIVKLGPHYYRPTEVESMLGNPTKAERKIGWMYFATLRTLADEKVQAYLTAAKRVALIKPAGFRSYRRHE